MAKRSNYERNSERVEVSDIKVKKETEKAVKLTIQEETPETIRLVLMQEVLLKYTGPITQNLYVFNGAGAEIDVDREDAEIMLNKRGSKSCCGGSPAAVYFARVE